MTDSRTAPTVDSAPGWLTRLLRTFGDISASETRDVVVMFFNIFMLLVAYYVLKTVREPLVLLTGGAELKSYAAAAQAAVLLLYVPAYGMLAARLPVSRLVTRVNLAMAGMIELFFVLGYAWVRRRGSGQVKPQEAKPTENGFGLVFRSPYLRLIALLLVVLNIVNTTGEFVLSSFVTARADVLVAATPGLDKGAFIGEFYGNYFFWVNIASVVLQMFVVSRLVKYLGMGGVLFTLPVVALGAYGMIMAGATMAMVRWMKTAENACDYSVMNTAKQMLWLPTTREEKYAAKQAIDTFFVRMGDLLSAGVVFLGTHQLTLSTPQFAATNLGFVVLALIVAWLLLREYQRLTGEPAAARQAGAARLAAG